MSDSDNDSDDYFDDEIDDVIVPGTPDAVKSAQTDNRPAKRRRLDAGFDEDAGKLSRRNICLRPGSDTCF